MASSSVPTHLSREMSDYAWPLWRPPPLQSLSHSLKPSHRCNTTINYTSIVMKTYLIHKVYCERKIACQPKEQTIATALTKTKQNTTCIMWANQGRKRLILRIYYCLRLLEGWHVQLTLPEMMTAFYSQKTYLSHHTDWGDRLALCTEPNPK